MSDQGHDNDDSPVLLFDGVCNACNAVVRFVVENEPAPELSSRGGRSPDCAGTLKFASLQSAYGRGVLQRLGMPTDDLDTLVYLEGGRVYTRSDAALRIAGRLRGPYAALRFLLWIPRPLRDLGYRLFAALRYRLFGKSESCMIPTPALRARFLDA